MRTLLFVAFGIVLLLIHVSLLVPLRVYDTGPDPLLLLVIFMSLFSPPTAACISAFTLGLCQDAFSGVILGTYAFTKTLVAVITSLLGVWLDPDSSVVHFVLLTVWLGIQNIITIFLVARSGIPMPTIREWLLRTLVEILYTLFFSLFAYPFLRLIREWTRRRIKVHGSGVSHTF